MRLGEGGIDVFYIDESGDRDVFVMSAIAIPFLRDIESTWTIVWEDQYRNIRDWRRRMSRNHEIPVKKELHGNKFASGRGRYRAGKHQFRRSQAISTYRTILGDLGFLPNSSIITVIPWRRLQVWV